MDISYGDMDDTREGRFTRFFHNEKKNSSRQLDSEFSCVYFNQLVYNLPPPLYRDVVPSVLLPSECLVA